MVLPIFTANGGNLEPSFNSLLGSHASFDSGVNEYLDGNVYDKFNAPKWLHDLILSMEL